MAVDNSLDSGETNASAFECVLGMKTLENTKQFVLVLHVKANAVVFNKDNYLLRLVVHRADFYLSVGT
jgi:hypothetical protein